MASTNAAALVFPPGEILKEELEERGWTQTDLAEILGRPVKLVNEILAGKRAITPETARGLSAALGTSPELWMNLESQYQLNRTARSDDDVSRRAKLFEVAPIKEMQRRGWIAETRDVAELERSLCAFFDVDNVSEIHALPHAAKKSTSYDDVTPAQCAWVQRVRTIAASCAAARFGVGKSMAGTLNVLRTLMRDRAEIRHVPRVLAEAGIRLVVVEPLASTRIDGVCLWLSESEPVIALSLRFDRIDSFWFALGHELGHVNHGDGVETPIVDLDLIGESAIDPSKKPASERAADDFAEQFLIPHGELNGFIARVRPLYSKAAIKGFAARLGIHPGIAVGQLAHRREIGFWHSRETLEKVRDIITDAALTDGWGHQPT